ncbi:uncharacterized protein LOC114314953 isoform X2 [Camellia sinensis]|uniref:uncharacterized protein LOC114314953 isoform X2 n=1 Tax=Camellia sinensis TaxID=4442 RepID=UPI001035E106|nr:uncharacterized protein LOC114314953 isoform X2 [Camellia sinensis]
MYVMRPLSGGHRVEGERPAAPAARAGAGTGVGASRRARVRGRGGVQRWRGGGWPALPTSLTYRGQGGATYQIPFAPPPADHELVGFHDLPPASSEYTQQSLELNASMMGMLQQTFDLLALYSIPIPTVGGVLARPSVPAGGDGEGRVFPRTKAGALTSGVARRLQSLMTMTRSRRRRRRRRQSHWRRRPKTARTRAQMTALMMLLDLRPGRGLGRTPRPEILCH